MVSSSALLSESPFANMPSRLSKQDCSEASKGFAGEPITSPDLTPPPGLQEDHSVKSDALYTAAKMHSSHQPNSSAAPSMDGQQEVTPIAEQDMQTGSATKRPMLSSKDSEGKFRRVLSGIFKKSSHQNADTAQHEETTPPFSQSPSNHEKERRKMPFRKISPKTSPSSTRSNTPPSPGSQKDNVPMVPPIRFQEPSQESIPTRDRPRAFTLSFRDKLHWHKHTPVGPEVQLGHGLQRGRFMSADPTSRTQSVTLSQNSEALLLERQIIQMAADSGTGLKARSLSITLTEDLQVIPTELYTEYCDQSKLIGRRGKSVGKGATATVRLMNRKGGCSGEVFAVKKFRGKSRNEKQEEYEQKVKSEYTIAKSVHHPNIVETFRLCTYSGRWNQVMEFCDQGDLFNLVKQGHLQKEDHLKDRVCLFKQLVQGIHYLHDHGIAHRDIKLENILITKDSKLKITDFGISEVFAGIHPGLREAHGQCGKDMGEARLCTPGMCGSPPYVAPEVIAKLGKLPVYFWCLQVSGTNISTR